MNEKKTAIAYLTDDGSPLAVSGAYESDVQLAAMAIKEHHQRNRVDAHNQLQIIRLKAERDALLDALKKLQPIVEAAIAAAEEGTKP
jgi:ribosomal protein S15P/S13E